VTEPWYNENLYGSLWGAIGGGVGGTLGGLWGALAGVLVPRGKGRSWLLGAAWVFVGVGAGCLVYGLYALSQGQPFGIWFPPCNLGLVFVLVFGIMLPVMRKQYAVAEARRLEAEAFRRQ